MSFCWDWTRAAVVAGGRPAARGGVAVVGVLGRRVGAVRHGRSVAARKRSEIVVVPVVLFDDDHHVLDGAGATCRGFWLWRGGATWPDRLLLYLRLNAGLSAVLAPSRQTAVTARNA